MAVLMGFSLTNGLGTPVSTSHGLRYSGAGIYTVDSSPSLYNLIISDNGICDWGGGIYCDNSSPSLENVTITDNSTTSRGGGICCFNNSCPFLVNVTISGNSSSDGGGICCFDSNPSIENVTISFNDAGAGGGIYCSESSPSLENVTISNNYANDYSVHGGGGGVYCYFSGASFENVTIANNNTNYNGGGIYCRFSSPSLVNVAITGSSANVGGGICCDFSIPVLVNVTISDNFAGSRGGGINCFYSSPNLTNITVSGNSANTGGGIYCRDSDPDLVNCILWNDTPQEIYFHSSGGSNTITISYSDIEGEEAGIVTNNNGTVNWLEGNIDDNPLFVSTGWNPLMLQDLSPCVNAGIPDTTGLNLPEFDLAGNSRVFGGRIDMGAYENQNVIVNTDEDLIPMSTKLNQNYPNPFNPTTTINYSLKEDSKVSINIYNIKGQKVKQLTTDQLSAGQHSVVWDGRDDNNKQVSSGIYFYKLKTNNYEKTRKMILLK